MNALFDLSGQRILITGATGGIGAGTARVCAALGAELVLVDQQSAEVLATELGSAVVGHHLCDVSVRAEVEAIVAGNGPIDALVAAAAICPWDDWQEPGWDEVFDQVMAVNLLGAIHGARACLPGMIERRHGRIVLVGSVAGRMGGVLAGAHYVASKGGLHALVKWLAQRGAPHGVAGQRHRTGDHRHRHDTWPAARSWPDPPRLQGSTRRGRLADRVLVLQGLELHLRLGARRQWRPLHDLRASTR